MGLCRVLRFHLLAAQVASGMSQALRCVLTPSSCLLPAYNDSRQAVTNEHCHPGKYHEQLDNGVKNYPKRACQFNRTILQNCSGLEDSTYGYRDGRPCVIVKMNRVGP